MRFDAQPTRQQLAPLQMHAADIEAWLLERDPTAIGAWNSLGPDEYARAFAVAQTAGTDIVDDIYFAMVDVVGKGGSEVDFQKLVIPTLKAKGWLGGDEGAIASRVELIYDTNLRMARASGRWTRFQKSKAALPYIRAFTVGDERVRHPPKSKHSDHRAWEGIILPVDHWFWTVYWPPLGFRCRCAVVQMTRGQLARYKYGVTSEADLASRIERLGPPVFAAPAAPIKRQIAGIVDATNSDDRMPGMPEVSADEAIQAGDDEWQRVKREGMQRDVQNSLARIGMLAQQNSQSIADIVSDVVNSLL